VNIKVVPLLSRRTAVAIVKLGNLTPGFDSAIKGSFHFLDLAEKDPCVSLSRKLEIALEAGQIVGEHHATGCRAAPSSVPFPPSGNNPAELQLMQRVKPPEVLKTTSRDIFHSEAYQSFS
jgi:hypothetical protein